MAVLCIVADVKPPDAEYSAWEQAFHNQAVVCGDFGGLSFVGQLAFSQPPRSADVVWSVHGVPAGLDPRQSANPLKYIGNSDAGLYSNWVWQYFGRSLFLPAAEENAVCGRGHAGAGILSVG